MTSERQSYRPLGLILDIPPENVGPEFYTGSANFNFVNDSAERAMGYADLMGPPLYQPVKLHWIRYGGVDYWLYAGPSGVGVWNGGSHSDVTPLGWVDTGAADGVMMSELNGLVVLNDSAQTAWYWDPRTPTTAFVALPDWSPQVAFAMRSFKNFLFAINVADVSGDYAQQLRWSDAAAPGQVPQVWTPAPDNLAGDSQFSATPGPLVDGRSLRDSFIVYKKASTYAMNFVGGQYVFQQRKLFSTTGVLGRNCVAEWQGKHFVLADGDVMAHNGVEAQSIADNAIRRTLFNNISATYYNRCFCIHSAKTHEFVIAYPSGDSTGYCDSEAAWNYRENKWSFRSLGDEISDGVQGYFFYDDSPDWDTDPQSWDEDVNPWFSTGESPTADRVVLSIPGINILAGAGLDAKELGKDITAFLVWGSKDFGAPDRVKYIHRIWPRATAEAEVTIEVRIGSQFHFGDAIDFSPWRPFVVGRDDKLDFQKQGRLLTVEFRSIGGPKWALHGFDVEVSIAGKF